jgi:alpha-glucosidase (family GH31 glycosyl hydrolase)
MPRRRSTPDIPYPSPKQVTTRNLHAPKPTRLNAAEMFVDVEASSSGTSTQWVAEGGVVDLFLLPGPAPADVTRQYAELTGTTAMPQMFAIGYHQCRCERARVHVCVCGGGCACVCISDISHV